MNNQWIGYFKTGIVFNKIDVTASSTLNYADNSPTPSLNSTSTINHSRSDILTGIILGIGTECAMTMNWHFSFDFGYTLFGPNSKIFSSGNTISPRDQAGNRNVVIENGFSNQTKINNIQNANVMFGLKYYV